MNNKRIKRLKITELSQVDKGANQHADVILMKRDAGPIDSLVDIAKLYGSEEQSVDFREAVKDELERRKMHEMWDKTWPLLDALRESIHAAATQMTGDARNAQIDLNVSNFKEKLLAAINQKEQDMDLEALTKRLDDLETQVASLTTDKADLQKKLDEAQVVANLSDVEKAHYDALDDSGKDAFAKMSPEDRADAMKKPEDEVSKRFESELQKRDAVIASLEKRAEMAELTKRVETDYPNIAGEPAQKAQLLKSMESIDDEATRTMALGILKSHNESLGEQMKEIGKQGGADTTAADDLEKLAKSHADANKVSYADAYSAVLDTPEGKKLYEQTLSH